MKLDPQHLSVTDTYKLLIGLVTPRPIAFVTTMGSNGVINGAPFSFYNVVCTDPPLLALSIGRKEGGILKDTASNILNTGEFVIHVTEERLIESINYTSIPNPSHLSELAGAGLHTIPSVNLKVPRVEECRVAMECVLHKSIELGKGPDYDLIIGQVVYFHVDDSLLTNGKVQIQELSPIGRLAGLEYTKLGDRFSLDRPKFEG